MSQLDAIAVIDKPLGMTSHDVVSNVRKLLQTKKVGHAGTLDPAASGVLVLGINRGTRFMQYLVGDDKKYEAVIRLGVATVSDDAAGEIVSVVPNSLTADEIEFAMQSFRGDIRQRPSKVSAIKVNGKRAHDLVRSGVEVDLPARPVRISKFSLEQIQPTKCNGEPVTDIWVKVECSSGTYVRALARDLGEALQVGGSVISLRRTQAGRFGLADAQPLVVEQAELKLLPLGDVAKSVLAYQVVAADQIADLSFGRSILLTGTDTKQLALLDLAGNLVAVGELQAGTFQPVNVYLAASGPQDD